MSDHELLLLVLATGVVFLIIDFGWKIGVQNRLDKLDGRNER